jgi:hypothetical protein
MIVLRLVLTTLPWKQALVLLGSQLFDNWTQKQVEANSPDIKTILDNISKFLQIVKQYSTISANPSK